MKPVLVWACVALVLGSHSATAQFYMYCTEPSEPFCITSFGTFDDQWSFDRCRRDVEMFLSEVDEYRDCLLRNSNEAVDHANQVIERFNCRAEGRTFCP